MKTLFCKIFSCLVVLFSSYIQATQINDIYSASIPVENQLSQGQSSAFDQALFAVVIKSSGQLDQQEDIALLRSLLPAEPFVQAFSYRENPAYTLYLANLQSEKARFELADPESNQAESTVDDNTSSTDIQTADQKAVTDDTIGIPLPFLLDVTFAPSLVEQKMTQLNIPIWGAVRPSVLVWVVIENEGERSILGTSDENILISQLEQSSAVKGVPLFLPVADLEDVNNINIDELWGLFSNSAEQSSKRYNADAVVIVRMKESLEGNWAGNWLIELKGTQYYGSLIDKSSVSVIAALVANIADTLSKKYAIGQQFDTSSDRLSIEVNEINSFDDFVDINNYLLGLPPVSDVKMTMVNSNKLYFHLKLLVSHEQFYEHIELGNTLEPIIEDDVEKSLEEQIETNPIARFVWISGK